MMQLFAQTENIYLHLRGKSFLVFFPLVPVLVVNISFFISYMLLVKANRFNRDIMFYFYVVKNYKV